MKRALALAEKEARDILRERTIVLAVLVQLFVAAFSAFLAVGLLVLYDPGAVGRTPEMQVGYAGPGGFDDAIADAPNLELVRVDPEEGRERFRAGELDALARERYANASGIRTVSLLLPEGEVQTSLLVSELKTALDEYEHELREQRAERLQHPVLSVETGADPQVSFTFAYSVLIPLLVATPVFLAGAITADALSDEINEGTMLVLRASPLTPGEIVVGKLLAPVLLVPAQVALWLGLLWANGIPVANLPAILLASTALGAMMAAFGTLVASLLKREGPTQAAYTLLVLALALLSLLLPQDPANLIARAGVGTLNAASWLTIGIYVTVATLALAAAVHVVGDRLAADRLQPGTA